MEIRDSKTINGKGLFATRNFKKGDLIFLLNGEIFDAPTRETIHIGLNKHIYDEFGIYINHSFTPNICILNINVTAITDIISDEELVFNYNDSEINMAAPFYINNILVNGKYKV